MFSYPCLPKAAVGHIAFLLDVMCNVMCIHAYATVLTSVQQTFMFIFKFTQGFMSAFLLEVVTSIPSMLGSWNLVCYLPILNFILYIRVASVSYLGWGYGSKYIADLKFILKFTLTFQYITFTSAFLLMVISWVHCMCRPWWLSWMRIRLVIRRLQIRPPWGWQHSCMQIDHEIFSMVILFLPLLQEG